MDGIRDRTAGLGADTLTAALARPLWPRLPAMSPRPLLGDLEDRHLPLARHRRVLRVVAQPYVIDPAVEPVRVTASMGATV